eukprot:15622684-Heterocapsa_arctica.AAC.1
MALTRHMAVLGAEPKRDVSPPQSGSQGHQDMGLQVGQLPFTHQPSGALCNAFFPIGCCAALFSPTT